jgi:hypothetical protein
MSWFEAMTRIFPSLSPGRVGAAGTDRRGARAPARPSDAAVVVAAARAAPKRGRPASESETEESCRDGDSDDSVAAAAWLRRETAGERQRTRSNPFARRAGAPVEVTSKKVNSRGKSLGRNSSVNIMPSPSKAHAKDSKRHRASSAVGTEAPAGGKRSTPSNSRSSSVGKLSDSPSRTSSHASCFTIDSSGGTSSHLSRSSSVVSSSASASGASGGSAATASGPVVSMVTEDDRATWSALVEQMHGVCNEAARRRAERLDGLGARYDEPLSKQYLVDRCVLSLPESTNTRLPFV